MDPVQPLPRSKAMLKDEMLKTSTRMGVRMQDVCALLPPPNTSSGPGLHHLHRGESSLTFTKAPQTFTVTDERFQVEPPPDLMKCSCSSYCNASRTQLAFPFFTPKTSVLTCGNHTEAVLSQAVLLRCFLKCNWSPQVPSEGCHGPHFRLGILPMDPVTASKGPQRTSSHTATA